MKVRGLRNNNPANIRRGSTWLGLSKDQTDRSFCQFDNITYGIRALLVLLRTYHYKYKLNTIDKVIHRFAPLCENNTYAYIGFVCKYMYDHQETSFLNGYVTSKISFNDSFPVNIWHNKKDPSCWVILLCKAICKMESGVDYTTEDIEKAIALL